MFKIKTEHNWLNTELNDILQQYFATSDNKNNALIEYTTDQGLKINGHSVPTPLSLFDFMHTCMAQGPYSYADFVLYPITRTFEKKEIVIKLTETEASVLELLILYKDEELPKDLILETLGWHHESITHTLESHLSTLRQKILPYFDIINTEQGYKLQQNA